MEQGGGMAFLFGADMEPEAVGRGMAGGRFVARAWVASASLPPPLPTGEGDGEIWGILIATPAPAAGAMGTASGTGVTATTGDGRTMEAIAATPPEALADPAATLAAARYWELPPAYVAALAASVAP